MVEKQLYVLFVVVALFSTSCLGLGHDNNGKTLKMVNLVYRHGARSPLKFYPTDPYQEKFWPDGAGQLTQYGMQLEYDLGKFFRERYVVNTSLIDKQYRHKDVVIYSSDADRCIQSAQAQLAGIYPPSGYQIWNSDIPWQPIPIHTIPGHIDDIFHALSVPCPRLSEIYVEKAQSREYKEMALKHKKLLKTVSRYSGLEVTLKNLNQVVDPIRCEIAEKLELPSWIHSVWDELSPLDNWIHHFFYSGNDETSRLLGGPLLGQMVENMKKLAPGSVNQEPQNNNGEEFIPKLNMWSGHDLTVLALSAALGVHIDFPVYATSIMLELYQSSDAEYFVEIAYRKDYKDSVEKLKLKGCDYSCPLKTFLQLTKGRTALNRSKFCKGKGKTDVE